MYVLTVVGEEDMWYVIMNVIYSLSKVPNGEWWYVTLSPYRSPRDLLVVFRHGVRYLTESINFPLTKSYLTPRGWSTGSFPSMCQVPNGEYPLSKS